MKNDRPLDARSTWAEACLGLASRGAGAALLAFLALPIIALVLGGGVGAGGGFVAGLRNPAVLPTLMLSLGTTVFSLVLVVALGTPLAWWLARPTGRLRAAAELFVQLPIIAPPAVAGLALLLAFGRRGLVGPVLAWGGVQLTFTTAAVVMAQVFVSAPFYVQTAAVTFAAVDAEAQEVARTLGASPMRVFFQVVVPGARAGLTAGAALSWARALGELGATLMFAGNLPGRTQTLPLAIYTALESDLDAARSLSIVLVVVALGLLIALRGTARFAVANNARRLSS